MREKKITNMTLDDLEKIRRQKKTKRRRKRKRFFKLFVFLMCIIFFIATGISFGIYMGIQESPGQIKNINIMPNIYTSTIYDINYNEYDKINGTENREYVTLDNIPKNLQHAFIAIEDERFYEHNGVDPKGIFRAIITKITKNKVQGASTITQQLIKNTITKVSHNSMKTKIKEQYLALKLEKDLIKEFGSKKSAKDHILEVYLNAIYLYHGLNGVKTAANYYFNKDVKDLDLAECAVIAAITKSPAYYAPDKNPENNKTRKNVVLKKMLDLNFITQEEYENAKQEDVYLKISQTKKEKSEKKTCHSYFVDKLIQDVTRDLQEQKNLSKSEAIDLIYNGGLKIYSTIDTRMQNIMDKHFKNDNFFPKADNEFDVIYYLTTANKNTGETKNFEKRTVLKNKNQNQINNFVAQEKNNLLGANDEVLAEKTVIVPQPQSAMIIIDYKTGEVRAIRGGRGEKNLDFELNRAIDSERQPGSVFKILASFAPAIDLKKATAATIIDDAPFTTSDGYSPKNYYKNYRGPSTIRDAIKLSMNIVAVKNMINTGVANCFDYLLKFGFTTLVENENINGKIYSDKVAATALGGLTHGINQIEVTSAFGTIANLGKYNKPVFYKSVLDHDNNLLLENKVAPRKVLEEQSAYILTDMMQDAIKSGTGTKAKFKRSKVCIAGKTGTTNDTKDLMFVGYTPYYVAGIWLGFDHPKTMKEDRGYHLKLWSTIMEEIHETLGLKEKNFDKPNGLVGANICKKSGALATDACKSFGCMSSELFFDNTQPKKFCALHQVVKQNDNSEKKEHESSTEKSETKEKEIEKTDPSSEKKESEAKITESTETKNSEEVEIQETIENKIVEQNNEEKENINIAETEPIILEN